MKKIFIVLFLFLIYSNSFANKIYKLKNIIFNIKNNNINSYYYKNILKKKFGNYIYINDLYKIKKFLYKLNHFSYINFLNLKNNKILFILKYKYIINNILIKGNKIFNNNKIFFFLNKFKINYFNFLNNFNIFKFKIYLINKYKKIGKYNVKINFFKINLNNNKCLLKLVIKENNFFKLNNIYILGNNSIKNNIILSLIYNNNFILNFLFSNNFLYNKFLKKINNLKYYYFINGYLDFYIKNIKIKICKNNILNIFINLFEGEKYKIYDIIFKTNILNNNEILNKIKKKYFKKNIYFNYKIIKKIIYNINIFFNKKGYINLNFNIKYKKINKNKIIFFINIIFEKKFYINKILFKGNKKIKYIFLRKKIPILDGELYNIYLIKKGLLNLKNTNFFSLVKFKKKIINDNKVNIIYKIIENKNNNIFNFNIGYGEKNNIYYNILLSKKNIFINNSLLKIKNLNNKFGKFLNISFIYPINKNNLIYFKHKILLNNLLYDNFNDYGYLNLNYNLENSLIFLINKNFKYKLGLNYNYNYLYNIKSKLSYIKYFNFIKNKYNLNSLNNKFFVNDFFLINNLIFNKLDNKIFPTFGYYLNLYSKYTLFNLNNNYYKIYFSFLNYIPLNKNKEWILSIFNNINYINKLNNKKLPFYEYFNLFNNIFLRGFNYKNIGFKEIFINSKNYKCKKKQKICLLNNFFNNNFMLFNNIDIIIPNKYFFNNYYSKYIRLSIFLDTGILINNNIKNIFKKYKNKFLNFNNNKNMIKLSIGSSLKIITPIGLLNFSFGLPIKYINNNEIDYFKFNISNLI